MENDQLGQVEGNRLYFCWEILQNHPIQNTNWWSSTPTNKPTSKNQNIER